MNFKEIPDHPGWFATEDGHVFRLTEDRLEYEPIGNYPLDNEDPYIYSCGNYYKIATLIAKAFIPNDISGTAVVFHLDRNRHNNSVPNLVWVTKTERKLLLDPKHKEDIYRAYLKSIRGETNA